MPPAALAIFRWDGCRLARWRQGPSGCRLVDAGRRDLNGVAVIGDELAVGLADIGERERAALRIVLRQELIGRRHQLGTALERRVFALNFEGLRRRSRQRA